jgi:hypothetical protein
MNIRIATVAIGALAAASLTLNAQAPQTAPTPQADAPRPAISQTPQTPPRAPAAAATSQTITISGCLQEEKDVPGLKPNVAERAGVTNDFVVTNVKMSPASSVSGIGVASKYEVEGIAEAELKKHLNHQVELMGTIVQTDTTKDDAPDFKATSLKMLAQTCAAQ